MIIFATIITCYSIFISALAFFYHKKQKGVLFEKGALQDKFDKINIELEAKKNDILSLQKQSNEKEDSIKSKDTIILDLSTKNASLIKSEELTTKENKKLEDKIITLDAEIKTLNESNSKLASREAEIKTEKKSLEEKIAEQKTFIEKAQENLKTEFENIASKHLKTNSSEFLESSSSKLTDILKPYAEGMEALRIKVEGTYDKESKERFALEKQVENLLKETNKISLEANNLTNALKGKSKTQGNWGEMILETILQDSGLMKGYQYSKEENIKDEDGNNLRPDFIVKLPNNRAVIIDSKTSLTAYEKFNSATNSAIQELHLKEHISSIKNHIDVLSSKKYDDLKESLDFTLMFIPIEPAYLTAIKFDPELLNYAYKKRILLISPTNLIACLKLINELWRREEQSKNHNEILKQVGALYDKFAGFVESMISIKTKINATQNAYEEALNQLKDGKGNIVTRFENIKNLGIKTSKNITENKKIPDGFLPEDLQKEDQNKDKLAIIE